MNIGKGQRTQRIALERATVARDALGTKAPSSWSPLGSRWARVFYGSGSERREAGVEQAAQSATFNVLADPLTATIVPQDRIQHLGLTWDVTGIARIGVRQDEIEITAVASRG